MITVMANGIVAEVTLCSSVVVRVSLMATSRVGHQKDCLCGELVGPPHLPSLLSSASLGDKIPRCMTLQISHM